jgi:hypothetical protein
MAFALHMKKTMGEVDLDNRPTSDAVREDGNGVGEDAHELRPGAGRFTVRSGGGKGVFSDRGDRRAASRRQSVIHVHFGDLAGDHPRYTGTP